MDVWLGGYDMLYDWYVVDGKVVHYYDGKKYPEFLARMNKWYKSGYITKDFLSLNSNQLFTLYDNLTLAAYTGSVDNVKIRLDPRNLFNVVESAPYPRLTLGQKLHTGIPMWPVDPNLTGATAITSQCKNVENAVKLLNYGYTEEGHKLFDYGIEGVTYNMVNGKVVFTDFLLNPPEGQPIGSIYKYHIYPKFADPDTLTFASFQSQEGGVQWRLKWNDDPDVDDSYRMLPVTLSPGELEEVTEIMVDVTAYADEMKLKFITGVEPLSNYNAYIQRLNSMNFQRAKQIYQAAYDRLMK
jgi:putative aldouronate transport system substrate-binding protein